MRKITSSKGGRTKRRSARIKPEVNQRLEAILQKRGINFSDFVEQQVNEASANPGAENKE